ncbi:hypothetical protein GOEFS_039_00310 [Gordonia effusa NBRC 100432]|uniref:Uncharacterized protein n=1 Tax=Gordonia effusa NBRC 100432 TaxID=1077974 RepID=H0QY96_9ACTN|nr:hypothetical protein GOEFS_039_00310 [Gordonia effusa NBRC 100432]
MIPITFRQGALFGVVSKDEQRAAVAVVSRVSQYRQVTGMALYMFCTPVPATQERSTWVVPAVLVPELATFAVIVHGIETGFRNFEYLGQMNEFRPKIWESPAFEDGQGGVIRYPIARLDSPDFERITPGKYDRVWKHVNCAAQNLPFVVGKQCGRVEVPHEKVEAPRTLF